MAAGSGTRLGADRPKAFVEVAGQTLLEHAVDTAVAAGADAVVVVAPVTHLDQARMSLERRSGLGRPELIVVAGGAERSDSVAAGLAALDRPDIDVILVHDAARAFTPAEVYGRVIDAVRAGADAAIPALPVVDTIKVVDDEGVVRSTPDRASLRAVQTPQGFGAEVLRAAHADGRHATDDAALVEAMGRRVVVVDGHPDAFKVTTPADLVGAEGAFRRGR